MSTYTERAEFHKRAALLHLESARDYIDEQMYGLAATDLRAAMEAMDRASAEQQCADMAASSQEDGDA